MRTFNLLPFLFLSIFALSCSDSTPFVDPDPTIDLRSGREQDREQPFKASLGVFIPILNGTCDDGSDRFTGSFRGNATYIGLIASEFDVCASDAGNVELKFFNPAPVPEAAAWPYDTIIIITDFFTSTGNEDDSSYDDGALSQFIVTGGTGRFANASGEGTVNVSMIDRLRPLLRDTLSLRMEGRIRF